MKRFSCLVFTALICCSSIANVTLPKFFSNNMVLQRNHAIPVWGWAGSKEKITVQLHNQTKSVVADKAGKWRIDLTPEEAGGPYTLTIKGKNIISITNVLIGDVWVCSGQSNMEMKIANWGFINNYKEEIAAANYPAIRQFEVTRAAAGKPQADVSGGSWQVCSPTTAGNFSATAYFFARKILQETNVPIGLINTSWGGTMVETWISKEAFENDDTYKEMVATMNKVDIDALMKAKIEKITSNLQKFKNSSTVTAAEVALWKNANFDDKDWKSINVPGLWEQQGLDGLDGNVWLRKTINITAADAGKAGLLELAMIDDNDDCYLNGTKIGSTASYNEKRRYSIPVGIIKEGKNVIAVRVNDTGGGGGIYGEAADVKITLGSSVQSLAGSWLYSIESVSDVALQNDPNSYPSLLYNSMIYPLIPFAIKGAIWYQGENNTGRAYEYRTTFPLMITDWRRQWQQGDFPFYFVQLASYNADNGNSTKGSTWAELREAQAMTLSLPNTGMAVTTDIGDAKDIHPKNKQDVGKRLALLALHNTYNKGNVFTGPTFLSQKIEGNKIVISFTNTGSGLMAKDVYGYLKGFEIAGADKKFYYAKALIEGDKVLVFQDGVTAPVAVRYSWADDAGESNFFNKEGLPAAPFRTDKWKGITEEVKYNIGK